MYIFLDESYNLTDRNKKQFISINGFSVLDEKNLFKRWNEYRRRFIRGKRRIHATDQYFDKLKLKALKLIDKPDATLVSVFQVAQEIPFDLKKSYFYKGKLNFDKVYFDLVAELLKRLNLQEYKNVTITIDSRKHKGGVLGKNFFKNNVINFLNAQYQETIFNFTLQPSSSNILLELADFVSNIFYHAYIKGDEQFFNNIRFKLIQLKNPLK